MGLWACDIEIPEHVFECRSDGDCPNGWSCSDARCTSEPERKSSVKNKPHDGGTADASEPARDADVREPADTHKTQPDAAPTDPCEPNPCGKGSSACVAREGSYACECAPGYAPSGPTSCMNINECLMDNACSANPNYPCRDADPFYTCDGQFLRTPMPDYTPGAATLPSYTPDALTVFDSVTNLRWQRFLPDTYPGCTGPEDDEADAGVVELNICTWPQAEDYCYNLELDGFTEWRLPNKIELETLIDVTRPGSAAVDILPDTPPLGFWTNAPYSLEEPGGYWYVDFKEGWSYTGLGEFRRMAVRCVR